MKKLLEGKVYFSESRNAYFYIESSKRVKKHVYYSIRRVLGSGSLSDITYVTRLLKNDFKASNFKISIHVHIPRKDESSIDFLNKASGMYDLLKKYNGRKVPRSVKMEIGRQAIACIYFVNENKNRYFTLRDVAKALKFKKYSQLYKMVEFYMTQRFTQEVRPTVIKNASDTTIVSVVRRFKQYWKAIYGYNKNLNTVWENEFKLYAKQLKLRGLVA